MTRGKHSEAGPGRWSRLHIGWLAVALLAVAAVAGLGAVHGLVSGVPAPLAALLAVGAVLAVAAWERLLLPSRALAALRRARLAWLILGNAMVWLLLVLGCMRGLAHLLGSGPTDGWTGALRDALVLAVLAAAGSTLLRVAALVGWRTLLVLLDARHHRPRPMEHVCACLLLAPGATVSGAGEPDAALDLRQARLLQDVHARVEALLRGHGAIIAYREPCRIDVVWPLRDAPGGTGDARVLRCLAAVERARVAAGWPDLRTGISHGVLVVAELGETRRTVGYMGEALQQARVLALAAGERGRRMLARRDTLQHLAVPVGLQQRDVGRIPVPDSAAVEVSALRVD